MQKNQLVRIGISTRITAVKRLDVLDHLAARIEAHALKRQGKIALLQSRTGISCAQRFDIELFLCHDRLSANIS